MKNINYKLILIIFIEELLFSFIVFNNIDHILMKALISITLGLILSLVNNKTIRVLLNILFPFIFVCSYLYYAMYGNILTIGILANSGKAVQFLSIVFDLVFKNMIYILIFLLPCLIMLFKKQFKITNKKYLIVLIALILTNALLVFTSSKTKLYSFYNLLFNVDNKLENVNCYGLLETKALGFTRYVFGFNENSNIVVSGELSKVYSKKDYNVLDTKFSKEYKEISDYLKVKEPTNKNEYTGIFKGKNLIFVLAESFSELGINKKYTPTLYRMYQDSIRFNNYYSPLYPVSTSDTEYMFDYSLIPSENTWSIEKVNGNTNMYSLAELFNKLNYKTSAYHDYDYSYYQRQIYMKNLGFNLYEACGNGLENKIDCTVKYPSDYELFNNTVDDYINSDNFYTYYITMSGHGNYGKEQNIAMKNLDKVSGNYSNAVKEYIAANMELDKGLESLLNKLKDLNKLDDTVIVIIPDHYPYTLTLNEYNDALNTNKDNTFEKNKMPLIIYNNGNLKDKVIDKQCSSLDILPTLLNMYGFNYDSRLLMGHDIMSNSKELVIFSNRSFKTSNGFYNSLTGQLSNITSNELENYKVKIYEEYKYSRLILENDYYKYIK